MDISIFNFALADDVPYEREVTLRLLDEIRRDKHKSFISEVVTIEINRADQKTAAGLRDLIKEIDPEELYLDEDSQALAERYIKQGIIPAKYENDAFHIAIASVNDLDVVVSWNFKHIVKVKTKKEVTGVNALMGYKEIEIYSPLEVVEDV